MSESDNRGPYHVTAWSRVRWLLHRVRWKALQGMMQSFSLARLNWLILLLILNGCPHESAVSPKGWIAGVVEVVALLSLNGSCPLILQQSVLLVLMSFYGPKKQHEEGARPLKAWVENSQNFISTTLCCPNYISQNVNPNSWVIQPFVKMGYKLLWHL